jgi:hypothetical protein
MVVKHRTVTELPMPDDIIKKVNDWGAKSMKEQFHHKLEFLNRMKQKYDWDGGDAETDEGLNEPDLVDPDLDSNTPGVFFDEPKTSADENHIAPNKEVTNAAYAAANANLTPVDAAEITGVDLPTPPAVTDDEDDADADDDDIIDTGLMLPPVQNVQHLDDDDKFEPNTVDDEPQALETALDSDDDEGEDGDDEDDEDEDDEDDGFDEDPARRYPCRKQVAKAATVIDFDNKAYNIQQGIIHLNPAVFETEPSRA